jgi:phage baseplate assembly protein W
MNRAKKDMFGQGLGFPPRVGADGRLVWSGGEENVRESLRLILLTEPGERLMREEFGCGLRRFLFEPNTVTTRQLIRDRVTQAINRWEPRVALESVDVEADVQNPRLVAITLLFRLVTTQELGRMNVALQLEG